MKTIYCSYQGFIEVTEDFECDYCSECDFCPENDYFYEEEESN